MNRTVKETRIPGEVPRLEIPGWRDRFGVVAGITGRGDGDQPFDLGLWTGQPVGQVMSRWRALRASEPGFNRHVLGNQVHRSDVFWHEDRGPGWVQLEGVDGHATRSRGVMLYATVADCIPVYLVDPVRGAIALLHAGWRGTAAQILKAGVTLLEREAGATVSNLVMHCGVGICGECYEVGSEVMDGLAIRREGSGPYHVDLRSVLAGQAEHLGMQAVSISSWCTAHDRKRFFSHRASAGADGRMVAYLGLIA